VVGRAEHIEALGAWRALGASIQRLDTINLEGRIVAASPGPAVWFSSRPIACAAAHFGRRREDAQQTLRRSPDGCEGNQLNVKELVIAGSTGT